MKIAFYAPLKSPTHASPSGDRKMARLLMRAISDAGHDVELASQFRSWEGRGERDRQNRLRRVGEQLGERLIRRYRARHPPARPDVWFTYHVYHKAPDWLGPAVSRELKIPYLIAEASHAPKQAGGPWAEGYRASMDALQHANAIFALNRTDIAGVQPLLAPDVTLVYLKPFQALSYDSTELSRESARRELANGLALDPGPVWLLTVGMMRADAKLSSYQLLARALQRVDECDWRLIVVGDGVCRREVEDSFQTLRDKVVFAGFRSGEELGHFYAASDVFLWPAINEAYGMAILEAQCAGLPVVAGDGGGVPDIVRDTVTGTLVPEGEIASFAAATRELINDRKRRVAMGTAASEIMQREHGVATASGVLSEVFQRVTGK